MRVLIIGGCGYVGSLVCRTLAQQHTLRLYDLRPPVEETLDFVGFSMGNVNDPDTLEEAVQGMDALIYMAMGSNDWKSRSFVPSSFDANVKGVYLSLQAAHNAGIAHAVYTSSMSVYDGNLHTRYFPDEDIPPDASHIYGFTKRLGEECCRVAVRQWGMSVNALRLCLPTPTEKWLAETQLGKPTIATTENDVARALLAALDYRDHGFNAFMISGDYEQKLMNMSKARRLLGWEPLARPTS
jgi:nucleoside-diphosphate-sugar epimerase